MVEKKKSRAAKGDPETPEDNRSEPETAAAPADEPTETAAEPVDPYSGLNGLADY